MKASIEYSDINYMNLATVVLLKAWLLKHYWYLQAPVLFRGLFVNVMLQYQQPSIVGSCILYA